MGVNTRRQIDERRKAIIAHRESVQGDSSDSSESTLSRSSNMVRLEGSPASSKNVVTCIFPNVEVEHWDFVAFLDIVISLKTIWGFTLKSTFTVLHCFVCLPTVAKNDGQRLHLVV